MPLENALFAEGGAESGAVAAQVGPIDSDLALLVERWDALPEALRAGIVAMVKAAEGLS